MEEKGFIIRMWLGMEEELSNGHFWIFQGQVKVISELFKINSRSFLELVQ